MYMTDMSSDTVTDLGSVFMTVVLHPETEVGGLMLISI